MANVTVKESERILFLAEAREVSPLGFDCDIALDGIASLRDDSGRFHPLSIELKLSTHNGEAVVRGQVAVYSVRRASQSVAVLTVRFTELEPDGYRLIAEHLAPDTVVCLQEAKEKLRA